MEEEAAMLITDNDSDMCEAGLAGGKTSSAMSPSIVGSPDTRVSRWAWARRTSVYVGGETQSKKDVPTLKYPSKQGTVTNCDNMEKIWHHPFHNKLHTAPEGHRVLLTEALRATRLTER